MVHRFVTMGSYDDAEVFAYEDGKFCDYGEL